MTSSTAKYPYFPESPPEMESRAADEKVSRSLITSKEDGGNKETMKLKKQSIGKAFPIGRITEKKERKERKENKERKEGKERKERRKRRIRKERKEKKGK